MFPVYVNHLMPGLKRDMPVNTLGTLAYDSNQSPHNKAIALSWAFGVPTAGWRNAPAYSLRGSTRGSAKLLGRSSPGARTQEHTIFRVVRVAGA